MSLAEFEERVARAWEDIPPEFRERVEGPVVVPEVRRSRGVRGMFILGECVHTPDWGGGSELASTVVLYYGSFLAIARRDPDFDLDAEIRETVVHEVQHHIEDRVGKPRLRDLDWAEQQNALRHQGRPHAPRFWRGGERVEQDGNELWAVGGDLFLEVPLGGAAWKRARREGLELRHGRRRISIPPAEVPEEARLFEHPGLGRADHGSAPGDLVVAVWRQTGLLDRLKRGLGLGD